MYKSVSAFAPIANPINCPWGQKAFKGYFGEDQQQKWKEHERCWASSTSFSPAEAGSTTQK